MADQKRDGVEMESIAEHTFDGKAYKPGDTFHVCGDGGGWSADMFADSMTALGHAVRVSSKPKAKAKVADKPKPEAAPKSDTAVAAVSHEAFHPTTQAVETVKK